MTDRKPMIRSALSLLLVVFVFVNIAAVGVLGRPQVARAQGLPVIDAMANALGLQEIIGSKIFEAIWDVLVGAATAGVIFLAQRVAYDTAIHLADAGAGKTPVFQFKNFDEYLQDTAEDAMAQALDVLATDWVGLDICKPLDIRARLSISLGLRGLTKPQARCTWDQIGAAWDEQWEKIKKDYGGCSPSGRTADGSKYNLQGRNSTEDCMLALARDVFKPSNTELGVSVEAGIAVQNFVRKKELASTKDREEGAGFTPVKDLISEHIESPAAAVAEEAKGISGPNVQAQGFQAFSGVLGSGAKGALGGILGIFANTFLSRMGSNVMDGLFKENPSQASEGGGISTSLRDPGSGSTIGVSPQVAALLTQTVSVRDAGLYDILSEFTSCPSESGDINRRPDECVIDTDFEAAVRSAESGDPLTIKQAMEKDLLKKNWKLVSPSDVGLNTNVDCRNQAYCHSNIAKLRQARIVPLGFEIAAALSPIGNPWTLGEVVAGFNNCNAQGGRDDAHQFCHLIDPNWLLKAPLTRCKAEVPGPMLATQDSNIRHSICVDKPTCLQDDGKGSCESPWGYCMREKNIWRFNGDSCPAQFSTCATYTGVSPGAQQRVSYLSRTVDFGVCTEQDVGCRQYATVQSWNPDAEGNHKWVNNDGTPIGSLYFNGKATTCTQPGCTQFIRQDGSSVYLKKAPLYLKCYDSNISNANDSTIDWPEKLTDLAKLNPRTECKDYAPVCAKDEVGCTRYTPDNDDPAIPAIASAGDRCANECVGYNTYKQMPITFERAKFPLYFIPETAQQCSGAELGCDQFVNVESGEKLEYYSFVRQCEKPAPNNTNSVVFYAWEGSDAQGYQLRSYVLKRGPRMYQDPTDVTPMYAAAYDAARVDSYQEICNKDLYTQRLADPDCRELFDRAGNAYYRLLSKTITVSDECTTMRKTDADIYYASREVIHNQAGCTGAKGAWSQNQGCQICEGGGALQNGVCLYAMMKSEATSCRAEASGCRAYTGNAGNNVRVRYQAKFDDLDTTGWSDGTLSAESVVVGGKSLRVDDRNVSLSISSTPAAGSSYLMNFWAKGQGELTVTFDRTEAEPSNRATFRLTGDWHQFSLGPMYVKSVEAGAAIVFAVDNAVPLFLDNMVIRETVDTVNVVKNSWKTPASCDASPQDNIPGEALGCQMYRDHNDAPVSLKSFTRICRDIAVGCEKLTDSHNTPEMEGKTYLMLCGKKYIDGVSRPSDNINQDSRACTPDWDTDGDGQAQAQPVCTISLGKDYCEFTVNRVVTNDERRTHGGAIVPADSIAYFVNRQEYRCDAKEKGCAMLGEVKGVGANQTETTVNKLVDAEKYEQLLCNAEVEGCEAYSSSVGGAARTVYFRDTTVTGEPLCEYKENVRGNSGWFVQGDDSLACYSRYRITGNLLGIKSQGDPGYARRVGLCPEQNNACKEFRDPADTSQLHPEGQPYYVLDNAKIDKSSCNGQVSLQDGCVLFNDTSDPTAMWNTTSTYELSAARNGALVPPVKFTNEERQFSANTILKVTRDRACAEWLACQSAMVVPDQKTNQPKIVCNSVDLCNAWSAQAGGSGCTNWVNNTPHKGKVLDSGLYSRRGIGWYDFDYSGYALANKYQIPDYQFVQTQGSGIVLGAVPFGQDAAKLACRGRSDATECTVQNASGACYGGTCVLPISGAVDDKANGPACRGYAATDAPFTFNTEIDWERVEGGDRADITAVFKGFKSVNGFDQANVCQPGQGCMCSYKRVDYGNGEFMRFYNVDETKAPLGLCRGGYTDDVNPRDKTGRSCSTSTDCRDDRQFGGNDGLEERDRRDGDCVFKSKVANSQGWLGYCLERDTSIRTLGSGVDGYACLTWMPLDSVPGAASLENQFEKAGFTVARYGGNGKYFCAETAAVAKQWNVNDCKAYESNPIITPLLNNGVHAGELVSCKQQFGAASKSYAAFIGHAFSRNSDGNDAINSESLRNTAAQQMQGLDQFSLEMIDYIEVSFGNMRRGFADSPENGSVLRIVNDLGRINIYAVDADKCNMIKRVAGWDNAGDTIFSCTRGETREFDGGAVSAKVAPAGSNLVAASFMTQEGSGDIKLGWIFDDGEDTEYVDLFSKVADGTLFTNSRIGAVNKHTSNDGHIAWFVFSGSDHRMSNTFYINPYNDNHPNTLLSCDGAGNCSDSATIVDITFRIVLRDACREVARMVNEEGNSAAWTDRLWNVDLSRAPESVGRGEVHRVVVDQDTTYVNALTVGQIQLLPPYGALGGDPQSTGVFVQRGEYTGDLRRSKGGIKFACPPGGLCGNSTSLEHPWVVSTLFAGKLELAKLFGRIYELTHLNSKSADRSAERRASGYNVANTEQCAPGAPLVPANNNAENAACFDIRSDAGFARPPRIAAIDAAHCNLTGDGGNCKMAQLDRFTLNEQNDRIVFGSGGLGVSTRFFSWANTNRMPIRDIIVDWGTSGRPRAGNNPGKYMNRKPSCQEADDKPIKTCANDVNVPCSVDSDCRSAGGGICRDDLVTFGNSPDACDPGYYEFIGAYSFDASDTDHCGYRIGGRSPQGMTPNDLATLTSQYGLTAGHRYCAFKPRVIVIDNWGWCNGTCAGGGCWGSDDERSANYQRCTNSNLDDNPDYSNVGTPFNGWVIVAEQK